MIKKYELEDEKKEREDAQLQKQLEKKSAEQKKLDAIEKEKTQREDALAYRMGVDIKQRTVFRQWKNAAQAEKGLYVLVGIAAGTACFLALFSMQGLEVGTAQKAAEIAVQNATAIVGA